MNSSLASADFSKGRVASERSNKPSLRTSVRNVITRACSWLGKVVSFAFARVLMIFVLGFAAGVAWQSYGGTARNTIASWSPHLAWVAPAAAPVGTSPERVKTMSLALATARQSLDKLATEISKLPTQGTSDRRPGSRRASER
jgi:hypothetical protein